MVELVRDRRQVIIHMEDEVVHQLQNFHSSESRCLPPAAGLGYRTAR